MDNENINYSDYKYDFESKIVMNEQEFEKQLNALHERVLSKALSDEEKNNDIVNIGLHFFLKNVRPYAASCSEA